MANPIIPVSPEAKKFVDDALANVNQTVRVTGGLLDGRYGNSQFLQLRQDCATGAVPSGRIPAEEICGLVLEKTVEAAKSGAPVTNPRHPLALFVNALDHRKYTSHFQGGGNMPALDAGVLGVEIYYTGGRENKATGPTPFPYKIPDAKYWPKGATESPVFRTYKGMAYDSAFTKTASEFLRSGRYHEDATRISPAFAIEIKEIAAQCFVNSPGVTFDQCRRAGINHAAKHHLQNQDRSR